MRMGRWPLWIGGLVLAAGVGAAVAWFWPAGKSGETARPAEAPAAPVSSLSAKLSPTDPPVPIPAYGIRTLDGAEISTASFAGTATLLNLWATWCAPCVRELPALARLQRELGGAGLRVAALSLDRGGRHEVEPFLARTGLSGLPVYLDPAGESMKALRLRGLPTTLLLDAQGREIARLEGEAAWDGAEAKALIATRLGLR